MRFKSVPLAIVLTLAAANRPSGGVAVAQIPEAPGSFSDSAGGGLSEDGEDGGDFKTKRPPKKWVTPKSNEPAPDPARDTIDEMNRARERASGTPEPEPTPKWD